LFFTWFAVWKCSFSAEFCDDGIDRQFASTTPHLRVDNTNNKKSFLSL
jgi:hypothetical protein